MQLLLKTKHIPVLHWLTNGILKQTWWATTRSQDENNMFLSKRTSINWNSVKYILFLFNLEKSCACEIWSIPTSNTIPWSQSQAAGSVLLFLRFLVINWSRALLHVYSLPSARSFILFTLQRTNEKPSRASWQNLSTRIDYWYGIHVAHSHGSHD